MKTCIIDGKKIEASSVYFEGDALIAEIDGAVFYKGIISSEKWLKRVKKEVKGDEVNLDILESDQ